MRDLLVPPWLLGAGVLFWAALAGVWPLGLALALAIEAPRLARWRLHLEALQWNRVADLCTALLILIVAYAWTSGGPRPVVVRAFQWLPLAFLPLALAQAWSDERRVALSALFISMRRASTEERRHIPSIDLGWLFLAILLVGGAAANQRTPGVYYGGLVILTGWALLSSRSRRYRLRSWLAALSLAALLGYAGAQGLATMQNMLEDALSDFFAGMADRGDPLRSITAMGSIGELKRSGRIALRVFPDDSEPPALLAQATYNAYFNNVWLARSQGSGALAPGQDGATWRLAEIPPSGTQVRSLRIVRELEDGSALLPLPAGSFRIARLPAEELRRSRLGSAQLRMPAARADYDVFYAPDAPDRGAPADDDLFIPASARAAVESAYKEAGLAALAPQSRAAHLQDWLRANFRYATYRSAPTDASKDALSGFLLDTRAGHCEFFASATVLLLRRAGIPARYATGYAVHEWSNLEGAWVARARDAHAWALLWQDGAWRELDTTPPNWLESEADVLTPWRRLADLGSWANYRLAQLRSGEGGAAWILAVGGALALWLAWRIGLRRRNASLGGQPARAAPASGMDSPWFDIEARLRQLGLERATDETAREHAERVARTHPEFAQDLNALAALHYRYRFDPATDETERAALRVRMREAVTRWLARAAR